MTGSDELSGVAMELEKVVLNDEYFASRNLFPSLDFYSGVIYRAIGFPNEFFSVLFALPRFTGWIAHWNELIQDPDNKMVRPRQVYLGERSRNYVKLLERQDDERMINIEEQTHEENSVPLEFDTEQQEQNENTIIITCQDKI